MAEVDGKNLNLFFQFFLFFGTVVLWWAWARPTMIKDYDDRKLPPNPTARSIFIVLYLLAYVVLVVMFQAVQGLAVSIGNITPMPGLFKEFESKGPMLAVVLLGVLHGIPFVREGERWVLLWLHSTRHRHQDSLDIAKQLVIGAYNPNIEEQRLNRETGRRLGLQVSDEELDESLDRLPTVNNWRKVASLLRIVRAWNDSDDLVLAKQDMELLAKLEVAHERKSSLAATVIKMIEHARRGGQAAEVVHDIFNMLSSMQLDPDNVAKLERRMKGMVPIGTGGAGAGERPLVITTEQLRKHMEEIDVYFEDEYETLLGQAADLTAKSIMQSGELAAERLEAIKMLGFEGFGRIEKINFDHILWMFLLVFGAGVLTLLMFGAKMDQQAAEGIARFSFAMSIAALVGAIVGSRRSHARAMSTPWSAYLMAGLISGAIYIGVQSAYVMLREMFPTGQPMQPLVRSVPWLLLPAAVTISICRLARVDKWKLPTFSNSLSWLFDRAIDGALVSLGLMLGYFAAVSFLLASGIPLPPALQVKFDEAHILPIPIFAQLQLFGFIIGFAVVKDVRRAAQARVVLDSRTSPGRKSVTMPQAGVAPATA